MKVVRFMRWKEIKAIEYGCYDTNVEVFVRFNDVETQKMIHIHFMPESNAKNSRGMIIAGVRTKYSFMPSNSRSFDNPLVIYEQYPNGSAMEAINDHLCSLFGVHLNNVIKSNRHQSGKMYVPKLRNIKESSITIDQPIHSQRIDDLFATSPNQDCVEIMGFSNIRNFKPTQNFFNTNHLHLKETGLLATEILLNFNGTCAFLYEAKAHDRTVVEFLNLWISNEKFRNLKFFVLGLDKGWTFNKDRILAYFHWKKFNSDERPVYKHTERTPLRITDYEFAGCSYLVRDVDGAVASIEIGNNQLTFAVWDMNEKQIARNMKDLLESTL